MTGKIFSKEHRTFNKWLKAQKPDTRYAKRITSLHERFPSMNLRELKHVKVSDRDLSGKPWDNLTSDQKRDRILALEVLRVMRKGEHLKNALANTGMKKETAILHLGKYLTKERGYWRVKSSDRIEAELAIYDKNEGYTTIITTSSQDRTLIGKYLAAVRIALKSGDPAVTRTVREYCDHRCQRRPVRAGNRSRSTLRSPRDSGRTRIYGDLPVIGGQGNGQDNLS